MTDQSVEEELLKRGRGKINWISSNMKMLDKLREEFTSSQPFAGLTIGVSLHIEQKTAALFSVLAAGGAEVVATGNLGTTNDDIAAALNESGIRVYGKRNDTRSEHLENVRRILRHKPALLLDNGADLIAFLIEEEEFSGQKIIGGTEETTSGGNRIREEMPGKVSFPAIVINDSPLKLIVENKHAVGQSVLESFLRITNLMVQGKRVVVFGYGWCGRGIAKYFKSFGAQVTVMEKDPIRALEAAVDGFRVTETEAAVSWGNVFITATGRPGIIKAEHFAHISDGAILANAGHFDWEIEVPELVKQAASVEEPEEAIERFAMPNGNCLTLLSHGRMFNLGGREPKGNSAESMDLGFTLQALSLECIAKSRYPLVAGAQPVPHEINLEASRRMLQIMMA